MKHSLFSASEHLALVEKAIKTGLGGCIDWDATVVDRIDAELARYGLFSRGVRDDVIKFVRAGGGVIQVKEEREQWKDRRDYWYKVTLPKPDLFAKGLFVEMELVNLDPDLPEVRLVNAHE